ncbi:hypothetical protein [Lysobacter arvi]|uniref:Uncharacterized protein n=1 Tax=Lysobacter arvi TaxID=3038776 RepID=A0ABU1CGL5_9GAMM|nr:hypothetical protein [Lysobacter arvi]MDR0184098.1 hypothetical protein [Lysobacter arvi]
MIGTLTVVAIMILAAVAARAGNRKIRAEVMRSFNAQTFDTPVGRVTGEALRIVKISKQSMRFAGDDVYSLGQQHQPSDAFLYCVGPGPSYFLAIAMAETGAGAVSVKWVLRPLTEERMRGALMGDRKATALAFGRATEA